LVLAGAGAPGEPASDYPETREAFEAEIAGLPWEHKAGGYRLHFSRSSIKLGPDLLIVRGHGARRFMFLNQGVERPETEAVIVDPDSLAQVIVSFHEVGYVVSDDWDALDVGKLLQAVVKSTEQANLESREHGLPELRVKGWVEQPTFDAGSHTTYWALEADDGKERLVNAVAVKLGRYGFQTLTWAGTWEEYAASNDLLKALLQSHAFDPGYGYRDHAPGDEVAEFGIASLVAVTAGARGEPAQGTNPSVGTVLKEFDWVIILVALAAIALAITLSERRKGIKARVSAAGAKTAEVRRFVPPKDSPRRKGPSKK
jgi:uncharacterized membrane-anchored protein